MDYEVGKILIAEPFMLDNNFKESVILLCDKQPMDGNVGFILNKPIDMMIYQLVQDFPDVDFPVYYGGPVGHDTIHYIHKLGHILNDSVLVKGDIYWGGNFNQLKALVKQDMVEFNDIKFFVGYSGWSPGQLENEIRMGSWVIDDMDSNYLFKISDNKLWKSSMQNKGDSFGIIAEMKKSISLN